MLELQLNTNTSGFEINERRKLANTLIKIADQILDPVIYCDEHTIRDPETEMIGRWTYTPEWPESKNTLEPLHVYIDRVWFKPHGIGLNNSKEMVDIDTDLFACIILGMTQIIDRIDILDKLDAFFKDAPPELSFKKSVYRVYRDLNHDTVLKVEDMMFISRMTRFIFIEDKKYKSYEGYPGKFRTRLENCNNIHEMLVLFNKERHLLLNACYSEERLTDHIEYIKNLRII